MRKRPAQTDEDVLNRVFGIFTGAKDPVCESIDLATVEIEEVAERVSVPSTRQGDERLLVDLLSHQQGPLRALPRHGYEMPLPRETLHAIEDAPNGILTFLIINRHFMNFHITGRTARKHMGGFAAGRRRASKYLFECRQRGHPMRPSPFLTLAVAASIAIAQESIVAQPRGEPGAVYATFERNGVNTEMIGLAVGDVSNGTKITLNCTGESCRFSSKTLEVHGTVKVFALTDMFLDTTFEPGTVLEIRVARPRAAEKIFQYEIRASAEPAIKTLCLPPGASKPVSC